MSKNVVFKPSYEIMGRRTVIEVWKEDIFLACIYPHEDSIVVVSKYLKFPIEVDEKHPPEIRIRFKENIINQKERVE